MRFLPLSALGKVVLLSRHSRIAVLPALHRLSGRRARHVRYALRRRRYSLDLWCLHATPISRPGIWRRDHPLFASPRILSTPSLQISPVDVLQ